MRWIKSNRLQAALFIAAVFVLSGTCIWVAPAQESGETVETVTQLSEYISWFLPPIAVLIAVAFYLAFSVSAIGTVGMRRQLARRLRAEKDLRLLSSAVEQSSEGMAVSDLDGNILFANRAFAAMHDLSPKQIKGRNLRMLQAHDRPAAVEDLNRGLEEQGVYAGEVWHVRKGGTPFPAFMHGSILRSDDGRRMGMIAALRDITEQKEAEKALHESEEKLKAYSEKLEHMVEERTKELDRVRADLFTSAKLAAMGRMGAGIAHQLNSPLCGGLLMLDSLMEDARGDASRVKKLETLRRSLEGMRDVVECMLSLAMVSRCGRPSTLDVNINDMIQRILGFVGLQIQKRRIDLKTSFAESLPAVRAKVGELDQVFLNLINNAIDAMADGGTLTVVTDSVGDAIRVEVRDTGVGITPEHMNRIFEPFFTTSEGKKGLGLGLSIARDIVDSYGGRITVKSEPDKGSAFLVSIPSNSS